MQAQQKKVYVQRPPRHWINTETIVEDGSGRQLDSRLWNISEGGFMAECEVKLPIGSEVVVDLPGRGRVRAEIRWAVGWRFGAMILSDA
jgi:hypothetical protein